MDSPSDIKSIPSSFKIPPFPTPSSPLLNLSAPLRLRAKLSSIQNPVTSALRPHNHPHPHGLLRHPDVGAASCRRADDEERVELFLFDRKDPEWTKLTFANRTTGLLKNRKATRQNIFNNPVPECFEFWL